MGETPICWCFMVIFSATIVCGVCHSPSVQKMEVTPNNLIQKLFDTISDQQVKEEVPLVPFKQFYRKRGIYPSVVKLNAHGKLDIAVVRMMLGVFDNNSFSTAWVSSVLLEAYRYGHAPQPTESQLMLAINVLHQCMDLNKPYNNSLIFFWPLAYNETAQFWQATALNLESYFGSVAREVTDIIRNFAFKIQLAVLNATDYIPLNLTVEILDLLGLENLTVYLKQIIKNKEAYRHIFHMCPDLDGTFVNLGFGSLLHETRNKIPEAYTLWKKQHNNLTSIFDALKKYAYRPFHNDPQTDSIDPRTYMYLRFFLNNAKSAGNDVALATTWAQNLEELKTGIKKWTAMSHNINSIDAVVCANIVYGITASILSGLVSRDVLQDAAIAQIYHNTSALLAFELETNMSSRPDLALLYYPSQMEFNWFVTRTLSVLDAAKAKGPLPAPVMDEVYAMLQKATKGSMTNYILSEAKEDDQGDVYFDYFLGDGDLTQDNQPLLRGEDRIFTTAMAANALLSTWTTFNETSRKSSWKKDVPPQVKRTVTGSIMWLTKYTFSGRYKPWNAFFSTSTKGETTVINQYPANLFQDANGTALPWSQLYNSLTDTLAVKGYIPPTEYATMLKEKKSPLIFHGYNTPDSFFPFWCSEPFTYSVTLLALSRYNGLDGASPNETTVKLMEKV